MPASRRFPASRKVKPPGPHISLNTFGNIPRYLVPSAPSITTTLVRSAIAPMPEHANSIQSNLTKYLAHYLLFFPLSKLKSRLQRLSQITLLFPGLVSGGGTVVFSEDALEMFYTLISVFFVPFAERTDARGEGSSGSHEIIKRIVRIVSHL